MYGKIFSSMFDGSLYGNWQAIITLQQMIVLCDVDGVVDMTPQAIAARTSIPLEIIQAGIEILEQPDKYSRTPDAGGRRIERLDDHRPWGWRIVNYKKYRHLVDSETVREQNRERQRRHRSSRSVTDCNASVTDGNAESRYAEAEADVNKKNTTAAPRPTQYPENFEQAWQLFPKRAGSNPKPRAFKAWKARIKTGESPTSMIEGTKRYADFCRKTGKEHTEYVMQAATFFGPDKRYMETWEAPKSKQVAGTLTDAAIMVLGKDHGVDPKPGESMDTYRARVLRARDDAGRRRAV